MKYLLFIAIVAFAPYRNAFSHNGHHHDSPSRPETSISNLKIVRITQAYEKSIRSIFEKKCIDCHGNSNHFPWYYSIPGAKKLIEDDITEAKIHLNFSKGYPFSGHGSPIEDLQAIRETIEKKEMPPLRYRILHWKSALTRSERETVIQWTRDSESTLKSEMK